MAEQDQNQEKTEEPTPKKLEKAREEGQVPRSRELVTALLLIGGIGALALFAPAMAQRYEHLTLFTYAAGAQSLSESAMSGALRDALGLFLFAALPLLVINFFIAGLGSIALSGWVFSAKQLEFKGSRIDPMAGLQRMFSSKSLVELGKSVLKVLVIGGVALFSVSFILPLLIDVARMELNPLSRWSIWWSFSAALAVACSTLLIALVDVPVQIVQFTQKMRMTRQEVKDEMKDSDGKPEVKARQRELQRQMSSQDMLTEVPKADVVIVNPEHYAVALRYDPQQASAPVVVAKGIDYLAFRIRGIAQEHDVPVIRSPALARSVYHHTPVGAQIPDGLFLAVAEVLAYVHQMRVFQRGGGIRPVMPVNPPIPPELGDDAS